MDWKKQEDSYVKLIDGKMMQKLCLIEANLNCSGANVTRCHLAVIKFNIVAVTVASNQMARVVDASETFPTPFPSLQRNTLELSNVPSQHARAQCRQQPAKSKE
jgi:hypothetical protein